MGLIDELRDAGLSEYEANAYVALLGVREQSGREVAKQSGVPPTRVFDVLKRLEEKGLVRLVQQKPMLWLAVKPEIGLRTFIQKKITGYNELENSLFESLKNLKQEPEEKIYERVMVSTGYKEVFSTITQYIKSARKLVAIYSVGEVIPSTVEIESARAVNRGVNLRFIATRYDEQNKAILERWIKDGWLIKYLPGSKEYTFAVFDKSSCAIVVKNPKARNERMLIAFDNKDLSQALYEYYELLWKKASLVLIKLI